MKFIMLGVFVLAFFIDLMRAKRFCAEIL